MRCQRATVSAAQSQRAQDVWATPTQRGALCLKSTAGTISSPVLVRPVLETAVRAPGACGTAFRTISGGIRTIWFSQNELLAPFRGANTRRRRHSFRLAFVVFFIWCASTDGPRSSVSHGAQTARHDLADSIARMTMIERFVRLVNGARPA
jgi:hypothetical protein